MIPKTIHYAWFGNNPLPPLAIKCMESWKKYCPDYEIKGWNESNYDYTLHPYPYEAYKHKKYAFVTDYMRMDILYRYGGIFFDTDVEIIKNFDSLMTYEGFTGFECGEFEEFPVNVGIGIGANKGNPIIKAMLDDYDGRQFIDEKGKLNMTPCPLYQTRVLKSFGLIPENTCQNLGDMIVFPTEYFCPKNYYTAKTKITPNTYSIHHYSATWMPSYRKIWHFFTQRISLIKKLDCVRKKLTGRGS